MTFIPVWTAWVITLLMLELTDLLLLKIAVFIDDTTVFTAVCPEETIIALLEVIVEAPELIRDLNAFVISGVALDTASAIPETDAFILPTDEDN